MQLVVLGMRSGSSVLTRLVNMSGASVGPREELMKANAQNPKGFWEDERVVALNNALLKAQGCGWNQVGKLTPEAITPEAFPAEAERARGIIRDLDVSRPWVLKDPRMCLLLPFWKPLLAAPVFVIIHRAPLEVAHSLRTHHEMPLACGLALWDYYMRTILRHTSGQRRALVSYGGLMADPVGVMAGLLERLRGWGVQGLGMPETGAITEFVDPALYREKVADPTEMSLVTGDQRDLHQAIEDGGVLGWSDVPPPSFHTLELLRVNDELQFRRWNEKVLRRRVEETKRACEAKIAELEASLARLSGAGQ